MGSAAPWAPPSPEPTAPRTALVHDWLTGMRGGEKALEVLCELYPHAELFTLLHRRGSVSPAIERLPTHRSFIQHLPFASRHYRRYLPLFPLAIERFDLGRFDLIISTSHCAAKSVIKPPHARHLCYCFTPMRYAWDQFDAYFGPQRVGAPASRVLRRVLDRLARWDAATSTRVDRYVAISQYVAGRIRRYYNRAATVVYPPVDTSFYHPGSPDTGGYFLVVSALVPYKRIELAIEACRRIEMPLRVVGTGPELERLQRQAGPRVEFLGACSDEQLRRLYREAMALILPGEEEFGIVMVEAQACGRPVVALARGGSRETVLDGRTGLLVDEPTPAAFAAALARARELPFDPAAIRRHALGFSRERFVSEISAQVTDLIGAPTDAVRW